MANNSVDPNVGSRNWTSFVLVENGKPVRKSDAPLGFRTSSGLRPTDEWLVQDGYYGFIDSIEPTDYNKYEQKAIKVPFDQLIIDPDSYTVTQRWSIVDMTAAEKLEAQNVLKSDINEFRDSLIRKGCSVRVTGLTSRIEISGTEENMRNISNLAQLATLYLANSITDVIVFRDSKNVNHSLTAAQMLEMWRKSVGYVSAVYAAAWTMKDSSPIPQDFINLSYWPSREIN